MLTSKRIDLDAREAVSTAHQSVTLCWVAFLQPHSTWKTRLTLAVEVR